MEQRLSQRELTLCDDEGRVRVRLSDAAGLQLLDVHGAVRAELRLKDTGAAFEITTSEGAALRLHLGGSEATMQLQSNRMQWYLGLFDTQNMAVQRITDASGNTRVHSDVFEDHTEFMVQSPAAQWVRWSVVADSEGQVLVRTGPDAVWSAPELITKVLAGVSDSHSIREVPVEPGGEPLIE